MAAPVKMFTLRACMLLCLLALIFNPSFVNADVDSSIDEETDVKIIESVLQQLNEDETSKYKYTAANVIESQIMGNIKYFLIDVLTSCRDQENNSCTPILLICEGVYIVDPSTVKKSRCFLKEPTLPLPTYERGFIVKRTNSFVDGIMEQGLQKLERSGGPKRRIIEILSVKKQETSGTEVLVTAKVAAGSEEGGDVLELEVCELSALLGSPGTMQVMDSDTKCFSLTEDSGDFHPNRNPNEAMESLSDLARWTVGKLNHASDYTFNYSLVDVVKADSSSTPGSGGLTTTLQLSLAKSNCPKNGIIPDANWQCVPFGQHILCTVSAWERPWRGDTLLSRPRCKNPNAHPITPAGQVEPKVVKKPAFCTGCLKEVNRHDPKVKELASTAITMLNEGQLSASPQQLLRILSAHRQVVNGIRYVLHVELFSCSGETEGAQCEISADAVGSLSCRIELLEVPGDQQKRLLSSLCQPIPQKLEDNIKVPGSSTEIHAAPETSSQTMEATSTQPTLVQETTVTAADVQVPIAGSNEEIPPQEFSEGKQTSTVPDEKKDSSETGGEKETEEQIPYTDPHTIQRRTRRATGLLGGLEEVDLKLEGNLVKQLADMALENIDDIDDNTSQRKLLEIVEAKKQLVNGVLYHLVLRVGIVPPCDAGEDCSHDQLPSLKCRIQVHRETPTTKGISQPAIKVMRSDCEPEDVPEDHESANTPPTGPLAHTRQRRDTNEVAYENRMLLGGRNPANLSDPYVQELVQYSLSELDRASNALYKRQIVRILSAERQVVEGIMMHATYELGYTNCRKGSSDGNEVCSVQEESDREICSVSVWDRPWIKERSVSNFSCSPSAVGSAPRNKRATNLPFGRGTHDIHAGMFREFMTRHNKKYASEEELRRRFHIFRANMRKVKMLQETEQGTAEYGATQFADLTAKEFKTQYLGLNTNIKMKSSKSFLKKAVIPNIKLAPEFDWRNYNVVTPVKNQGSCGSCWAFSVTGNVEGQWAIRRGQLLSLSEQELVDCDKLDEGCNGGLPSNAYESIQKMGGLETESDYPYEGRGEKCQFDKGEVKATVTGALNITTDEDGIAKWLMKNGPISIGINANAMQFYFGGVSHPWKMLCSPAQLDHGVLIVGYGVHTSTIRHRKLPYWIVKNSWGPSWGEKGYYRVFRGDGTCGVNQMATSAIVG